MGDEDRGQRLGVQISSRVGGDSPSTALGQAGGNHEGPHGEEGWTCVSGGPGMSRVMLGLVFNQPFGRMQARLLLFLECICSHLIMFCGIFGFGIRVMVAS